MKKVLNEKELEKMQKKVLLFLQDIERQLDEFEDKAGVTLGLVSHTDLNRVLALDPKHRMTFFTGERNRYYWCPAIMNSEFVRQYIFGDGTYDNYPK